MRTTPRDRACIVGAFEHPLRIAPDKSLAQLHYECAKGALADAGLGFEDVDAYFTAGDAPGASPAHLVDYMNLRIRYTLGTEIGGCSYISAVGHAAHAIESGRCDVVLITLAGKPRSARQATGTEARPSPADTPFGPWESGYQWSIAGLYANFAKRHMHQYGTTSEQLAWVKVAASHHAQHNEHAFIRKVFTVQDVLDSPRVADPLHRLDCCVITDGGGAIVLASASVARSLSRPRVAVSGHGETFRNNVADPGTFLDTGARQSSAAAFEEAGVGPGDIRYASIYDNFTIMVIMQLEDIGFCEKGQGGRFVSDGNLISGVGKLPFNTDGGGLCNNHPRNRGGMTKVIDAVRQLRGESHPRVQVPGCDVALVSGPGLVYGVGHAHSALVLTRQCHSKPTRGCGTSPSFAIAGKRRSKVGWPCRSASSARSCTGSRARFARSATPATSSGSMRRGAARSSASASSDGPLPLSWRMSSWPRVSC